MKPRKQQLAELDVLPEAITAAVPDLHQDPEITAAARRFYGFQAELRRVDAELAVAYEGPAAPGTATNAEADAGRLLAGEPVSSLTGPTVESVRARLIRQKHAIEAALPSAECSVSETETRVIQAGLKELRPVAEEVVADLLDNFEQVQFSLERWAQFCTLLSRHGFRADRRGGEWGLSPLENQLYVWRQQQSQPEGVRRTAPAPVGPGNRERKVSGHDSRTKSETSDSRAAGRRQRRNRCAVVPSRGTDDHRCDPGRAGTTFGQSERRKTRESVEHWRTNGSCRRLGQFVISAPG